MDKTSRIIKSTRTLDLIQEDTWSYVKKKIENYDDIPALVCSTSDRVYTYKDLKRGSANWASFLQGLSNDSMPPNVIFLSPNTIEAHVVTLGAIRLGSRIHSLNIHLPVDVLKVMIEESESNIIISDVTLMSFIENLQADFKQKFHVFFSGIDPSDKRSIERVIQGQEGQKFVDKKVSDSTDAFVFYSSGTTGRPKGIVVTHRSFINSILHAQHEMNYKLEDPDAQKTNMIIGTFAHLANCMLTIITFIEGGKAITVKGFNLMDALKAVKTYQATCMHLRPHLLKEISKMAHPLELIGSLAYIAVTGTALNSATLKNFSKSVENKIPVKNWYGATEIGGISYDIVDPDAPTKMVVMPNLQFRIVDGHSGLDLGPNEIGEICYKTPYLMKCYFKNPEATEKSFDTDGFFRSGDSGYYTEDEKLVFFDRCKDEIEVRGKKVSPVALEEILQGHPAVADVGVTGVANREAGELPRAFVVKEVSAEVTEEELVKFVEERVEKHQRLAEGVAFVDAIPRNHMGKIERRRLKEKAWNDIKQISK